MKKWMIIPLAGFIFISCGLYSVYMSIHTHKGRWETAAKEKVLKETKIASVDRVDFFHGKKAYRIVFGKDTEGKKVIAWVSDQKIITEYASDGMSSQEIIQQVKQQFANSKIYHAVPAIDEEDTKMWEVLFKDKEGKFNYRYYDFDTGNFIKSYRLNQT